MFKTYVANPIPDGVTNIRARYIQSGLEDDVVITFKASREAIDTIITRQQLKKVDVNYNYLPDWDLPERAWKGYWKGYEQDIVKQGGGLAGYIHMWVDQEQSIVIFRYTYSGW